MSSNSKKKKLSATESYNAWIVLLGVFFIAAGVINYAEKRFTREFSSENASIQSLAIPKEKHMWIEFDLGKRKRTFETTTADTPPRTLAEELSLLSRDTGLVLHMWRDTLIEFDRVKNNVNSWKLYKDDKELASPLSSITIRRGDRYTFKYE